MKYWTGGSLQLALCHHHCVPNVALDICSNDDNLPLQSLPVEISQTDLKCLIIFSKCDQYDGRVQLWSGGWYFISVIQKLRLSSGGMLRL